MEDATKGISDPVSEQFRTYLIKIVLEQTEYYSIWFTDISTADEQDKLLTNSEGEVLVFTSIEGLKRYIQSHLQNLPDSRNFEGWINGYTRNAAYTIYDIDDVRRSISEFDKVSTTANDDASKQIDLFNLIGDYRDLVHDEFLEEKMDDPVMQDFFDGTYTFHFWRTPEGASDPEIDPGKFKELFNQIIDYFVSRIQMINV